MKKFNVSRTGRRLNLRTRFLLVFSAVIAGVTILIATVAGYRFVTDMERILEQNGRSIVQIFAREAFFQLSLQQKDRVALQTVLESFVSGDVIYGQVVFNGEVVVEKNVLGVPLPVDDIEPGLHTTRGTLDSGLDYIDIQQTFEGRTVLDSAFRSVNVDSYVRLGLSFGQHREEIQQAIIGVVLVALGAVLLGSAVVLVYYQRTWRPLEVITSAMRHFGEGKTQTRAKVTSGDELELLALSFNEMADAIVKKDEQMFQVNLEMQRANRAKSDFLAAMSHDLKTPLHVIAGYTQLMLEGDGGMPSTVHRAHLEAMLSASDRLLEFIERILSFSRIESGEEPFQVELVQVASVTEDVIDSLMPLAKRKGLNLTTLIETQASIMADPGKVRQILSNLVENAIKYTQTGAVDVHVYAKNEGVYWAVRDTGPGIPERFRQFIFEPFGRLEDSQVRITEGMGLGLAIVRRYVKAHHGKVTVKSTPGQGSVFVVFLPTEVNHGENSDR